MPTLTPTIQKARLGLVRRLSQHEGEGKVLSVYVDLDPTEFGTAPARKTQVTSLANEAEELVEQLDQDSKKPLRDDVRLVREFLLNDDAWTSEARAVAVFASTQNGIFDVVKVAEPLRSGVFVEDRPHVQPLKEMVEQGRWCVVLVDRRHARILVGNPSALTEYDEIEDEVHGQHRQGGWSQARYARSVEEDVEDHLKNVADRVFSLHEKRSFDHFVIGASEELWPRISERLHPYVAERVLSRIDADVQMEDTAELGEKLKSLQAQLTQDRECRLLDDLRRRLATDERAAAELPLVLSGLNEARIGTLLVADGFDAPGARCPKCGYLSASASKCPVDGSSMDQLESVLDAMLQKAEETSAEVVFVVEPGALDDQGSIAALTRF